MNSLAFAGPCDPSARTITGASAQELSNALSKANLQGQTVPELLCGSQHQRTTYDCKYDVVSDATAAALISSALGNAGVYVEQGMGDYGYDATTVSCQADGSSCTLTATWEDTCH